jgi:hypothetical protein
MWLANLMARVACLCCCLAQCAAEPEARLLAPSRRKILASLESDAPPTYITVNPLRHLQALPKRHHIYQGIDGSYIDGFPGGANASAGVAMQMMVDFARITGSFPAIEHPPGTHDTVVEICMNASRLHPTGRVPHLQTGGSPWINVHGAAAVLNRSNEAPEITRVRAGFEKYMAMLAASNKKLGANVKLGRVTYDIESWGWSPSYLGVPGKQEIIDGIKRKSELIFNMSVETMPDASVEFYDYGESAFRVIYHMWRILPGGVCIYNLASL